MLYQKIKSVSIILCAIIISSLVIQSCGNTEQGHYGQEAPQVPVRTLDTASAQVYVEYSAAIEGKINVDIRAQVDGYIDQIYVDEGAYVNAGQPLFKINDQPYQEQLNTALANLHAAEAALAKAQIDLDKYGVLTQNKVVSDIQLKTVQSSYDMAKAGVEQSKAAVGLARINLGYATVKAPVSGFIGRIPKRVGNLVGRMDMQALTTLSDIQEIYAYFSMSEADFLRFNEENQGKNVNEKLKKLPPVRLILANGNEYSENGRIEMVDGQFDKNTGSISLRATFPNPEKLLRSGNTGKIRLGQTVSGAVAVPQDATFEQQDKVFVFLLTDSNTIQRKAIQISGKSGENYLISQGVNRGDIIITGGIGMLNDGMTVVPLK